MTPLEPHLWWGLGQSSKEARIEIIILDARLREWGLPRYHSDQAAAIDLHACLDTPLRLQAQAPATLISAGFALHIADPGITALVVPRSGQGHKKGLVLGNLVGVIDADYTGPIMISAWNRSEAGSPPVLIEVGERIAQMIFVPILRPAFAIVEHFTAISARGEGGFGSTG